jgi:nicotinamidase-related amidase
MTESFAIDAKRTAVLIMDYQVATAAMVTEAAALAERAASILEAARGAALPVIHVRVEFRPGYPEINPRNIALVERIQRSGRLLSGAPETQEIPAVAAREGDIVVVKHRIGAFSGTELDALLRSLRVETLVLFGIATSGVVLSTVRQAFDLDYCSILVSDCCADPDPALNATLLEKVLGRQARLITTEELLPLLRDARNAA